MEMNRRQFLGSSLCVAVASALPGGLLAAAAQPLPGEIAAVTGRGTTVALTDKELQALRSSLRGALLLPGAPGYDEARRVLNASID